MKKRTLECGWMKVRYRKAKILRRDRRGFSLLALLFFFLFPYIVSNFSGIEKQKLETETVVGEIRVLQRKFWGATGMPLEEYLEGMLAATIPIEYHLETLKAQAIILRTACMKNMEKQGGKKVIWDDEIKELYLTPKECEKLWKSGIEEKRNKIKQALIETKGIIAVWKEDIPELPFTRVTNGQTRDITEYVIHTENYDYMKKVSCPEDSWAENSVQYVEITAKEFQKKIGKLLKKKEVSFDKIVLYRDQAGYVKEVEIGGALLEGEVVRQALGLRSSCFYLEKMDNGIQIQTKGVGHGFGFSQYSAEKMAQEGRDYLYLLNYFFQNITLERQ